MKKINDITVGIDFSVTSIGAYRYANALAKTLGASITLIHVQENPSFSAEDEAQLVKNLEQIVAEEDPTASPLRAVKIKVLKGNAVDAFIELPENTGTDLIVLGSTGLSDVLTKLFGSVSYKISNQAHCPVLLVPRDAKWQPVKQLLFASDYDSMRSQFVTRITDFAMNINANVHFVNVRNYDPILEPKQKDINWDALITENHPGSTYRKETIYGNDTVAELKKYSEENDIQLMAFASMHRHFWSDLAHKSITGNMALSATIPLLVMHLDDDTA
jgi:nucleotide-binding universal stress UspA family protein